jgi:hypothetical protein
MDPMIPVVVRCGAALTSIAATLALVTACGSDADSDQSSDSTTAASSATADPDALDAGAQWLTAQLTDGVVHDEQYDFDDYGLTADLALSLDAVGGHDDVVQTISAQLARHVADYTQPGFGTLVSAGGTAKTLLVAQAAGADPTSYGGTDLVAQLEKTVAADGAAQGRIEDKLEKGNKDAADYSNVVGQSLAVAALDAAGSDSASSVRDYLLKQQCDEGWFRLSFPADPAAPDQTCDGDKTSAPDVDATAYAVLALQAIDDDAVADQVDTAVAWLLSVQDDDGSFEGAGPTAVPNVDSTGLAGRALAGAGETDAAEQAASWTVRHQVVAGCGRYDDGDAGAIAYDDAALRGGQKGGITPKTVGQFRRATVDSLPVLQWAPADATDASSC